MDKVQKVFHAVQENDFVLVKGVLRSHPGLVKLQDEDGFSLLHIAAIEGHTSLADMLIKHGSDVNLRDNLGRSPLIASIYVEPLAEHEPVAKLLIAKYSNVNLQDDKGNTPLHMASYGEPEIVKLLLASGADVTIKNNKGMTPLHNAVVYPEDVVVRLLLEDKKIDVYAENNEGKTALDIARQKGWWTIVQELEKHFNH